MASNMLTGDRRWAPARRGGMTVLGKVAVPKPINLPSQRLENHGLDPNVEIVPKGTLGWGSRPSSSTSNAWGSSSLSPNADSSSNSPSRLSARPSSAEAGTRPSTAGSDKVHDSTPNVWSSNSRPSSASGAITSSQASLVSLRPHSAEPRPGSSQLSRFAEPSSDISVAGSGERLEVTSLKNDGFSLNTGDFPSLGSVKSCSAKNAGSQGSLDSASHDSGSTGGVVLTKEGSENYSVGDATLSTDARSRADDSWRRDNPPYGEDGRRVGMEKWNGDTPPYQNLGILPQHFNAWRGPPVNNPPGGVWYRGPPGGPPPYGGPVPPGGFPMDSFHYYRPQFTASALPNPQQVPPPGAGPRGPHPRNGDMYRPQMPDAYIRPGMPVRPGFFSGPVSYDGYFGHPMGYCRPNDRDAPIMGMGGGPPSIYGPFPSQNAPDAGDSHVGPPGHGSNNELRGLDEVESGHHRNPQPYRVLLKPHDNSNEKTEEQKLEETQRAGESMEKVDRSRVPSWENDWRMNRGKDREKDLKVNAVDEEASKNFDSTASGSLVPRKVKSPENLENSRVDRDHARAEPRSFVAPNVPQFVALKDTSLIQKIEGLNAKARASDLHPDVMFDSDRPEQGNKWQVQDTKLSRSAAETGHHASYPANIQATPGLSTDEKVHEDAAISGPNISRRYPQSGHGKAHHHRGRGRSNPEDVDAFRNKPSALDPLLPTPSETSDVYRQTHPSSQTRRKYDGGHVPVTTGSGDNQTERPKMKEQHVKQRQEEEEGRAREQKAKAQMKPEELNRRTQVVEGSNSKSESGLLNKPQDPAPSVESKKIYGRSALSSSTPLSSGELLQHTSQTRNNTFGRSSGPSKEFPHVACMESATIYNQSVPAHEHTEVADADNPDVAPLIHSNVPSKQHRTGYKQKQSMTSEKNTNQKIATESPKFEVNVADDVTTTVDVGVDSSVHQRRRSNRGNRNKAKGDESSTASPLLSLAPKESGGASTASVEGVKLKASDPETEQGSLRTLTEPNDVNQLLERRPDSAHEEAHGKGSNHWKSQSSRRAPRNQQVNRVADKFHGGDTAVWTPVRTQNTTEVADETSERTAAEGQSLSVKSDQPLQNNNPRSKRAEMERYVPKPVAKEMAQIGSAQQIGASDSQNKIADEAVQQGDSGSSSVAVKESRNADSRQNRSARGHGSWRQRGTPDNAFLQGLPIEQSQPHFSQTSGNVQGQPERHQRPTPEEKPIERQIKHHDEGLSCDSSTLTSNLSNLASQPQFTAPAGRDQGISGRGKRHPSLKAPKGVGYSLNPDQKKSSSEPERSHNPSVAPEVSQRDPASAAPVPRESHGVVERSTLHWQPKSRADTGRNNQANRAAGDDWNTDESGGLPIVKAPKEHDEAHNQSDSVKDKMHEEVGQFDNSKRERRPYSFAPRPQSPVQVPPGSQESATEQHEAGSSLGPRKSGNQNASRFVRTDENRGDWNSSRQGTRQHNVPAHRERQRSNPNYKYQPVGPYNNEDRSSHFEGLQDGSQSTGPRYKERAGQSGTRRGGGNFHERQVGNA